MSIKMVVTDLDGTLLRDDKTVSERSMAALRRCREAGIRVMYATGRGGSAERLAPEGYFDGRTINNGAYIYDGDTLVFEHTIPCDIARPVLLTCDRRGIKISTNWGYKKYSNFVMSDIWPEVTNFEIIDFAQHELDAEELLICDLSPDGAAYINSILPEELYMVYLRDRFGQVMHRDATKGKAVAALARHWGIQRSEIVAFGDDMNDVDMLEYAGIGIAMGNSVDDVKAAADHVCLRNEEDGLAVWLEKNLL